MKNANTSPQPELTPEAEPSSFRLIATLGLAGLFSGLLLVSVYLYTRPIILANKALAMQAAVYHVLPGCASFETLVMRDGKLELKEEETADQGSKNKEESRIFMGYDEAGQLIGFAILAEAPGFQDLIKGIFGYQSGKQMIIGFEVLESKETPGLGDKILKDPAFISSFKALSVEPEVVLVKKGKKQNPNEVDGISGATISSKAVIRMLQNGLEAWRPAIEAYMEQQQSASSIP